VAGQIHGPLWWPGDDGYVEIDSSADLDRFTERPTLREIVDTITSTHAGDFRDGGRLTGDSYVTIARHYATGRGTVRTAARTYMAAELPSIADYVDASAMIEWAE